MKIFVVDDERIIRISLADELRDEGFEVKEFSNAMAALMQMKEAIPDIVVTDLKMPDMDGIEFLKKIKERYPQVYVVLMTAYSTVETAVSAMRIGAYDYIDKPFENEEVLLIIQRIIELKQVKDENVTLKTKLKQNFDFSSYVGNHDRVKDIFNLIKMVAPKDTSVLLEGETGTGKELLTNIIHYNSNRSKKPLIKVSCAILNKEMLESELFGHEKGAFTGAMSQKIGKFELANGGTLYLDDVDDVPLELQVKLLRALEEREIERVGGAKVIKLDMRMIASTKKDLLKMVNEGRFRSDLYYRLNVFPISLPALRERPEDIISLTKYFVNKYSEGNITEIEDEVMEMLTQYPFPGNVRELRNLCERIYFLSNGGAITKEILPYEIKFPNIDLPCFSFNNKSLNEILEEVEKNAIKSAIEKCGGNKAKAAGILGLPVSTLKSKIKKMEA